MVKDEINIVIGKYETLARNSLAVNMRASIAIDFAKNYGMIAAKQDGEDSSGRQKLSLLTSEEVAQRAVEVAVYLFNKMNEHGWITEIPEHVEK